MVGLKNPQDFLPLKEMKLQYNVALHPPVCKRCRSDYGIKSIA